MMTFLLSLHFVITVTLVIVILLQKSEGGAWGMGGGSSGGVLSPRGQANLLTRVTAVLAGFFIVNCLLMAALLHHQSSVKRSLIDEAARGATQSKSSQGGPQKGRDVPSVPQSPSSKEKPEKAK